MKKKKFIKENTARCLRLRYAALAACLCLLAAAPISVCAVDVSAPGSTDAGGRTEAGADGGSAAVSEEESSVRKPENPLAKNELSSDLVEKGEPYDAAGLLTYRISGGGAEIMSCDPAVTGELYIPDYIEGMPVTAIHDYAFLYCARLKGVTIPASVTEIGDFAFCYCTELASISINTEQAEFRDDMAGVPDTSGAGFGTQGADAESAAEVSAAFAAGGAGKSAGVSIGEHAFYRCYDLEAFDFSAIEAIGDYAFAYSGLSVTSFPEGLAEIGDYAFSGCSGLTEITLPDSLTRIGDFAFYDCAGLKSVVFPEELSLENTGDYIFYECASLEEITPPDTWTEVPEGIFYGCKSADIFCVLKDGVTVIGVGAFSGTSISGTLTIPASVTEIGDSAFYGCDFTRAELPEGLVKIGVSAFAGTELTEIEFPDSLTYIGAKAFLYSHLQGSFVAGKSLKYIGSEAFRGGGGLVTYNQFTSVAIGGNVEYTGDYAFSGNTSLKSVTIEEGTDAESWGAYIFFGCTELEEVTLPSGWTSIPEGMFLRCCALTEITLPAGLISIGTFAFSECTSLRDIKLPSGLKSIEESAFAESGLTEITFPAGLTGIGASAFSGSELRSLKLPRSLKTLGSSAFKNCGELSAVSISSGLESIGSSAFANCVSLAEITVPGSVKDVGNSAFSGCTAMKTAVFESGTEKLSAYAFSGCRALEKVILPDTLKYLGDNESSLRYGSAFSGCSSLREINLPEGLIFMGTYTFENCESLAEITLPSTLEIIGDASFKGSGLTDAVLAEGISKDAWGFLYGNSEYIFSGCGKLTHVDIPSNWTELPQGFLAGATGPLDITIPDGIVTVGAYAFYGCTGMKSIKIPDSVTVIGTYAFYGSGLTSIRIPDGVAAENFGAYAIGNCEELADVYLPDSWTVIPDGLFSGNIRLKSYTVKEGVTSIGKSAFYKTSLSEIKLPDSLTSIGDSAFAKCASLKSVTLPAGLTDIGEGAFQGTAIEEIVIPSGVSEVSSYAFAECSALVSAEISDGVEAIWSLAFAWCDALAEVSIPDSVTRIGFEAFYGSNPGHVHITCSQDSAAAEHAAAVLYVYSDYSPGIPGLEFEFKSSSASPGKNTGYGYSVIYGDINYTVAGNGSSNDPLLSDDYKYNYTTDFVASISSVTDSFDVSELVIADCLADSAIPITAIEPFAFRNCDTLTCVKFGSNIERIGSPYLTTSGYTFENCANLKTVDMSGSRVENIQGGSFKGCSALESVIFPETLDEISKEAFSGTGLTSLDFTGTGLTTVGEGAFKDCEKLSDVTFTEGVEWIDNEAFAGTAVTEVYLPESQYLLQPTAFDSSVIFNFTGDATKIVYWWKEGLETYYDPVLPLLLENNEVRVGQFFGEGLTQQGNYFISTEKAGLNVPYGLQSASAVFGIEGPPAGGQLTDGKAQTTASDSLETADPQVSITSDISDAEDAEEPEAEEEISKAEDDIVKMYEVVTDIFKENPFITAALVLLLAALIVSGGVRRYRKTR